MEWTTLTLIFDTGPDCPYDLIVIVLDLYLQLPKGVTLFLI